MAAKNEKTSVKVSPAESGTPESRRKALETAIAKIERDYGKGTIMRLGDDIPVNVEALSTGSLTLDLALGIGGVPKGRIVEIYGPEASGKTTLALHVVASAQRDGGTAAYVDVEHALEPAYARAVGVDIDDLLISQPDTGEQALDITESLVRSGAVDVVVVDSVAALIPRSELEGEIGDSVVGVLARLMSQAMRRLAGAISKNNCTVIFINQLRQKIGVMYGNPETTPGGLALKYYASVRIDVRRVESLKVGNEVIGNHTRAKVVKNKLAPPFREAEFDIMYGEGISRVGEIVDLGVRLELIDKGGAWFTVEGNRIQGRDAVKQYLLDNPEICERLDSQIRENAWKLAGPQGKRAAAAAGRFAPVPAVDISAQDFDQG
ncbi:MAG: recombinase RecA [Oscillospiraceae bacterium]|nr:recombinase RecA [Oscillospiraceae bacterium]